MLLNMQVKGKVIKHLMKFISEQLKMNGKETPKESFEKFTGHMLLKKVKGDINILEEYATEQKDRNYLFWQRDPLAILITDKKMAGEKLDYMHSNPLQPHWHQQSIMKQVKMNLRYLHI